MEKVSADETERLVNMESVLHGRVIGQEEAVVAIARAIRRARVGLKNPNRPIASFIFSGPTGPTPVADFRSMASVAGLSTVHHRFQRNARPLYACIRTCYMWW